MAWRSAINNIVVRYRRRDEFSPPQELASKGPINFRGGVINIKTAPERFECQFRFLNGAARYTRTRTDNVPAGQWRRTDISITDERRESLIESSDNTGQIDRQQELPENEIIDFALALRAYGSTDWLTDELLRTAELAPDSDGRVTLAWQDDRRRKHECVFARDFGYALLEYQLKHGGKVYTVTRNSDFRRIENLLLPYTIDYVEYRVSGQQSTPSTTVKVNIDEYRLGELRDEVNDFRIEWPRHTTVVDADTGATVRVETRAQRLDDETLARAAAGRASEGKSTSTKWLVVVVLAVITVVLATLLVLRMVRANG
jgi:hypothetical protein